MTFYRTSLILGAIWLVGVAGATALFLLVPQWIAVVSSAGLVAAAIGGTLLTGQWLDRRSSLRLKSLADATGFVPPRGMSTTLDAVTAHLLTKLDAASSAKAGFAALARPALVATTGGDIVAVTQGLRALESRVEPGRSLDLLFGQGFMESGGGLPEEGFLAFAGKRFDMTSRTVGGDRILVELTPSGHLVADDDLDTFVSAIAGGHTGIRFETRDTDRSPVLRALGLALETFDRASRTISAILRRDAPDPQSFGSAGLDPQLRELVLEIKRLGSRDVLREAVTDMSYQANRLALRTVLDAARASESGKVAELRKATGT